MTTEGDHRALLTPLPGVEVELGQVRLASLTLDLDAPDARRWSLDCHTKRPGVSMSEEQGEDVELLLYDDPGVTLGLSTDPRHAGVPTRVLLPVPRGGRWEYVLEAARYSVRLTMVKVPKQGCAYAEIEAPRVRATDA